MSEGLALVGHEKECIHMVPYQTEDFVFMLLQQHAALLDDIVQYSCFAEPVRYTKQNLQLERRSCGKKSSLMLQKHDMY